MTLAEQALRANEITRRCLVEAGNDVEIALAAAEYILANDLDVPLAHDIHNRKAQGILNRAVAAARSMTATARDELAIAIASSASSGRAVLEFIDKYRAQLVKILTATQLASVLEGAQEVADKVPDLGAGLPNDLDQPTFPTNRMAFAAWEHESRDNHGRWAHLGDSKHVKGVEKEDLKNVHDNLARLVMEGPSPTRDNSDLFGNSLHWGEDTKRTIKKALLERHERLLQQRLPGREMGVAHHNLFYHDVEDIDKVRAKIANHEEELRSDKPKPVTKQIAMTQSEFYHATLRNRDGSAVRCRASGKCKTWVTRPDDFQLPVKYGMYNRLLSFYLTPDNASEWLTADPTESKRTQNRIDQLRTILQHLRHMASLDEHEDRESVKKGAGEPIHGPNVRYRSAGRPKVPTKTVEKAGLDRPFYPSEFRDRPHQSWRFSAVFAQDAPAPLLAIIEQAAKNLASRNVLTRAGYDALEAQSRAKAFTVANVSAQETLTKIRDSLAENVREGADYETWRKKILDIVGKGTFMSDAHNETVFRTNVQSAFSDGQMVVLQHPLIRARFPYSAYDAIHDDRVRENNLALEKFGIGGTNVYRIDDPVFQTFRPPWDYNDRCSWVPMTIRQAAEAGVAEAQKWLKSGAEPSPPSHVAMPPFQPPPGFERSVAHAPLSIQLSMHPMTAFAQPSWNESNVKRDNHGRFAHLGDSKHVKGVKDNDLQKAHIRLSSDRMASDTAKERLLGPSSTYDNSDIFGHKTVRDKATRLAMMKALLENHEMLLRHGDIPLNKYQRLFAKTGRDPEGSPFIAGSRMLRSTHGLIGKDVEDIGKVREALSNSLTELQLARDKHLAALKDMNSGTSWRELGDEVYRLGGVSEQLSRIHNHLRHMASLDEYMDRETSNIGAGPSINRKQKVKPLDVPTRESESDAQWINRELTRMERENRFKSWRFSTEGIERDDSTLFNPQRIRRKWVPLSHDASDERDHPTAPTDSSLEHLWYAELLDLMRLAGAPMSQSAIDAIEEEIEGPAAFGMVNDVWHGPTPPSKNWVPTASGPRGGKRWVMRGMKPGGRLPVRRSKHLPRRAPPGGKAAIAARVAAGHRVDPTDFVRHLERVAGREPLSRYHRRQAMRLRGMLERHHGEHGALLRAQEMSLAIRKAIVAGRRNLKKDPKRNYLAATVIPELKIKLAQLREAFSGSPDGIGTDGAGDGATDRTIPAVKIVTARPTEHAAAPAHDSGVVPDRLARHLSDHQLEGVARAITAIDRDGGFLCADGTGVGKTRQLLAVAQTYAQRGKKVVLVSPSGIIRPNWAKNEIGGSVGKDGAAMGVALKLSRGNEPPEPNQVTVTTYEMLTKMKDHVDADTVILFDEAHGLKNESSIRSRQGMECASKAGGVYYATATPADHPLDLAYLFRSKVFGDKSFADVRRDLNPDRVGPDIAYKNTADMFSALTAKGLMVKREISLDGVEVQFDNISLPPEGKRSLEDIARSSTSSKEKAQVLMRQRYEQERYKIPAATDATMRELSEGRQVVLFVAGVGGGGVGDGQSVGTAGMLKRALVEAGVPEDQVGELHGGEGGGGKEEVEWFQSGRNKVLITTAQSGGTGHNLDDVTGNAPRTQIIITSPFSAIDNAQIWGRTHRLTTRSNSRIRYLFADTVVDKWNAKLIRDKVRVLGAVVAGETERQNIPESVAASISLSVDDIADMTSAAFGFWLESIHPRDKIGEFVKKGMGLIGKGKELIKTQGKELSKRGQELMSRGRAIVSKVRSRFQQHQSLRQQSPTSSVGASSAPVDVAKSKNDVGHARMKMELHSKLEGWLGMDPGSILPQDSPQGQAMAIGAVKDQSTKQKYKKAFHDTLDRMKPGMIRELHASLQHVVFQKNKESVNNVMSSITGKKEEGVLGFCAPYAGLVCVNGGKPSEGATSNQSGTITGVYAHELTHAIDKDRKYSDDVKWKAAYLEEIKNGPAPPSEYARLAPHEGFAEFGRMVCDFPDEAEEYFPECWAFWKSKGLV